MLPYNETPVQEINASFLDKAGIRLLVKREDLNHPFVSGNKWWKLRYNLEAAQRAGKDSIITFGGAYSNHLYATAAACRDCSLKSIGLIRGEETLPLNATLRFAKECGMLIHYVSRERYRQKNDPDVLRQLADHFGDCYIIPEGGTNELAVKGVAEFAQKLKEVPFHYLCTSVGTGGTLAGLITGLEDERPILGFSSLKGGDFLKEEVKRYLPPGRIYTNWRIETAYHFGGYGKMTHELLDFLKTFEKEHGFRLDPVYTGKMMYGVIDQVRKGEFTRGTILLCIHTGGLQGWAGWPA